MPVPYTFANAIGPIPLSQLDSNFAAVESFANTAGTVTQGPQPNITSVGTLTSLSVTGNVSGGYFMGNGRGLTGILANTTYDNANVAAFLPTYTGNLTANNVVISGVFVGNGSGLGSIIGPNVIGTVGNAAYATLTATVAGNSQPNITSVGTLTSLSVTGTVNAGPVVSTGNVTATYFLGNGSLLSGVATTTSANQLIGNTLSANVIYSSLTTVGTLSNLSVVGNVNANVLVANTISGSLTTAAQPNITSIGVLSNLSVTGNTTVSSVQANGDVNATGNINGNNILSNNSIISSSNITASGNVTASYFLGDGSQLSGIVVGTPTTIASGNASMLCDSDGASNIFAYFGNGGFARFGPSPSDPTSQGFYSTGFVSTNGNLQANLARILSNIIVTDSISIGANVSANGTIRANTFIANVNISSSGNIAAIENIAGNLLTGNVLTGNVITGNVITGNDLSANVSISATGNITGNNLISNGNIATLSSVPRVIHVANTSPTSGDGAVGDIWYQTY